MALPSAIKLFINPRTGLAFGNFNGTSQITNPTVTLGDTARFEIYLVEDTGISSYPRQEVLFPGTPGIKIAVGPIDESPQAGTWKVSFGGDITAALPFNITAAALATALNGLASIIAAGGVTVSKIGDNYNIVFNQNGARGDLLTDAAALVPLSTATVANLQIGDSARPQIAFIHLQRTIAGLATSFSTTAPSAITIDSLSAWNGSRATYRASIAPDPKGGSFTLAFDAATGTDVSSPAIAVGASAVDVQNALNQGALVDKVSVTQVGAYAYDITITTQPGTNGLTASSAGLISFSGYVGELSLNTAEAISLLDGAEEVSTNLEVEITSDSKTLTILQIPCTLKNAVIDAGSVEPLILDSYLTQNSADGRYARQANNLSDLADVSAARTNLDVYSKGQVDTAISLVTTPSDVLTKAGNLSGLTNLPLARANIGLGSTNNAQFNSVFGVSGSQVAGQSYTNYNLGLSGYSRTLEHRTENTAEEGQGDNSYVDYYRAISISENGASFTNITNSGDPTISGTITIERIISLDLANHRLRISDGNAECLLTNGALSFGNVDTGYGLSIDAVNGLTFSNSGTPAAQFGPAGITFTDGTIQTTAAFNFDPTGYATEAWVTNGFYPITGNPSSFLVAADIAGKADLDSPTFTGSPSLPTGTIAVTQNAGNNTTALATTEFVQNEVETATVTPVTYNYFFPAWSGGTSGAGAAALNVFGSQRVVAPTSAAGNAIRLHPISLNVRGGNPDNSPVNFSKRIAWGFRLCRYTFGPTSADSVCRVILGKTGSVGDPSVKCIGIGFTGTSVLSLIVHNGISLQTINTTFTPVTLQSFDCLIVSDGLGNASLYINGSLAATTAQAPTGTGVSVPDHRIEVENIVSLTSGNPMGAYYSNPTIEIQV